MTQPSIETLTELNIPAVLRRMIDSAYVPNDRPVLLAYVGTDGAAHLSFRGSTHFHSRRSHVEASQDPNPSIVQGRVATLAELEGYPAHIEASTWERLLQEDRTVNPVLVAEYEARFFHESNFSSR